MKKINLLVIGFLSGIIGLSSCLKGDTKTSGYVVGVIDFSPYGTTVVRTLTEYLYGPELAPLIASGELDYGDCYCFFYELDRGAKANSYAMIQANGYLTVSLTPYEKATMFEGTSYLTDTSTVLPNEITINSIDLTGNDAISGLTHDFLFFTHDYRAPANAEVIWDVSYYYYTPYTPVQQAGTWYYDVFFRARLATEAPEGATLTSQKTFNAYQLKDFLSTVATNEKERLDSNGSYTEASMFTLRLNFPYEINNSIITWKTETISIPVYLFDFYGY